MAFRGVPCYQLQVQLAPTKGSAVTRVFVAHGLAYPLQLVGGTEPLEDRPDLESIFGGFRFTRDPRLPPDSQS